MLGCLCLPPPPLWWRAERARAKREIQFEKTSFLERYLLRTEAEPNRAGGVGGGRFRARAACGDAHMQRRVLSSGIADAIHEMSSFRGDRRTQCVHDRRCTCNVVTYLYFWVWFSLSTASFWWSWWLGMFCCSEDLCQEFKAKNQVLVYHWK